MFEVSKLKALMVYMNMIHSLYYGCFDYLQTLTDI